MVMCADVDAATGQPLNEWYVARVRRLPSGHVRVEYPAYREVEELSPQRAQARLLPLGCRSRWDADWVALSEHCWARVHPGGAPAPTPPRGLLRGGRRRRRLELAAAQPVGAAQE